MKECKRLQKLLHKKDNEIEELRQRAVGEDAGDQMVAVKQKLTSVLTSRGEILVGDESCDDLITRISDIVISARELEEENRRLPPPPPQTEKVAYLEKEKRKEKERLLRVQEEKKKEKERMRKEKERLLRVQEEKKKEKERMRQVLLQREEEKRAAAALEKQRIQQEQEELRRMKEREVARGEADHNSTPLHSNPADDHGMHFLCSLLLY